MTPIALSKLNNAVETSQIREIGKLAERRADVLKLQFGESSLSTPQFIKDAATRALAEGYTFYTPNAGDLDLREAIAQKVCELDGARFRPDEEIVVTRGGAGIG